MKTIICGAYGVGTHLTKVLSRNREDVTLIDEDDERLAQVESDFDLLTAQASPSSIKALHEAGAEHADLFITVAPEEGLNVTPCILAKALGAKKAVAKTNNSEYTAPELQDSFTGLGVSSLVCPKKLVTVDIINGLKMSWVRQRWDAHNGILVMLAIRLEETREILNNPLKSLCGPDDPYHVVVIKRLNEAVIPGGNDELKLYGLAYFMTTIQYIPYIRRMVGKGLYVDVKNMMIMGNDATAVRTINTMPNYLDTKLIEISGERCKELNDLLDDDKALIINGDGRDAQLLMEEGIKSTRAFVALTNNAETNILACPTVKRLGVRKTVVMVRNVGYVDMAENLDIGTVINKKTITAGYVYQTMLDTKAINMRLIMSANADVVEFVAQEDSRVTKRPVKDLGLPREVTIGGLVGGDRGVLVSGHTRIQAGDIVVMFCHNINFKTIERLFIQQSQNSKQ